MSEVIRVEKHVIKKSHKMYKTIDNYSFKVKNLYNYCNYIIRQEYIEKSKARYDIYKLNIKRKEEGLEELELPKVKIISEFELAKMVQKSEPAKLLMAQIVQQTVKLLCQNWKSFFASIVDYSRNPSKYTGRPKLPGYKDRSKGDVLLWEN